MNRFIILCLGLFALSSCDFFQRDFYSTYTVENKSNHSVDLVYFDDGYLLENGVDTITIKKDSSYTIWENTGEGGHFYLKFLYADSLNVIFDKEKILYYYGRSILEDTIFTELRSPMNKDSYIRKVKRKHGSDYTYTITEEDYENAIFVLKEKLTGSE